VTEGEMRFLKGGYHDARTSSTGRIGDTSPDQNESSPRRLQARVATILHSMDMEMRSSWT
jgi:hypothetical protein